MSLLKHRKIEEINVTDLCKKAGVNRSTFYAHYIDIYDAYEKLEIGMVNSLFDEVIRELGSPTGKGGSSTYDLVLKSLETTLSHKELCELLIRSQNSSLVTHIIERSIDWCLKRYEHYSSGHDPHYRDHYLMMISGTIVLWYRWIISGFDQPKEEIATAISSFINHNVSAIWNS